MPYKMGCYHSLTNRNHCHLLTFTDWYSWMKHLTSKWKTPDALCTIAILSIKSMAYSHHGYKRGFPHHWLWKHPKLPFCMFNLNMKNDISIQKDLQSPPKILPFLNSLLSAYFVLNPSSSKNIWNWMTWYILQKYEHKCIFRKILWKKWQW